MKNLVWVAGGICGAVAGFLVWNIRSQASVPVLAHKLEEAWADHHTVA